MNLRDKLLKALGTKEICWQESYGQYAPFCPYCGDPAYGAKKCLFCGKRYIRGQKPRKKVTAEVEGYTAVYVPDDTGYSTIYIFNGEKMVFSSRTKDSVTEDELRKFTEDLLNLGYLDDD